MNKQLVDFKKSDLMDLAVEMLEILHPEVFGVATTDEVKVKALHRLCLNYAIGTGSL